MLAKNLPSGTSAEEIQDQFSKHGSVANIILPPSGVTAIIEFLEPSEARNAFRKLAYTKVSVDLQSETRVIINLCFFRCVQEIRQNAELCCSLSTYHCTWNGRRKMYLVKIERCQI